MSVMVTILKFKNSRCDIKPSIIREIKISKIELYLPFSNDVILSQYFANGISRLQIFNFYFTRCPQLLPQLPQLTKIWKNLTISNYCNPPIGDFNLKFQPPLLFIPL